MSSVERMTLPELMVAIQKVADGLRAADMSNNAELVAGMELAMHLQDRYVELLSVLQNSTTMGIGVEVPTLPWSLPDLRHFHNTIDN